MKPAAEKFAEALEQTAIELPPSCNTKCQRGNCDRCCSDTSGVNGSVISVSSMDAFDAVSTGSGRISTWLNVDRYCST